MASTYTLSRKIAQSIILNKIVNCSNEELGLVLEGFKENTGLRNYRVVDEEPIGDYCIQNVSEFLEHEYDRLNRLENENLQENM